MEINKLQKIVDNWIKKYGIRYYNELTNMAILTEEVGEVARIISRQYGEQSFKDSDHRQHLSCRMKHYIDLITQPSLAWSFSPDDGDSEAKSRAKRVVSSHRSGAVSEAVAYLLEGASS